MKELIQNFRLYKDHFGLIILFKLGFCLGGDNLDIQTSILLSVLTLHYTVILKKKLSLVVLLAVLV